MSLCHGDSTFGARKNQTKSGEDIQGANLTCVMLHGKMQNLFFDEGHASAKPGDCRLQIELGIKCWCDCRFVQCP